MNVDWVAVTPRHSIVYSASAEDWHGAAKRFKWAADLRHTSILASRSSTTSSSCPSNTAHENTGDLVVAVVDTVVVTVVEGVEMMVELTVDVAVDTSVEVAVVVAVVVLVAVAVVLADEVPVYVAEVVAVAVIVLVTELVTVVVADVKSQLRYPFLSQASIDFTRVSATLRQAP
jgi:hypothetical protein